jgi:hypothetical protein
VPAIPSPYSALLRHAKLASEEPWLFRSEGLDWRWTTWGDLARQATAWASHLAGHPPASRFAFPYRPGPESIALDLGIQGAGLFSAPETTPSSPSSPGGPGGRLGEEGRGDEGLGWGNTGGSVVQIEGTPVEVHAEEIMGMADRVQAEVAPPRRVGEREIVVLGGALETLEERAMLSWATVTGAAVALEPSPGLRVATAAWVRPTVFHGSAEETAVLRAWMKKKMRGLPFGRLRTLLVTGGELGEEEAAFWRAFGVRVSRVPFRSPRTPGFSLAAERHKHGI